MQISAKHCSIFHFVVSLESFEKLDFYNISTHFTNYLLSVCCVAGLMLQIAGAIKESKANYIKGRDQAKLCKRIASCEAMGFEGRK